jgi:Tfp pilus assembly protein PilN
LFDAVQLATPVDVALLSLEPDTDKNVVRITAEARDSDVMVAYIEQMQRQELFSSVFLVRHEINELDANHPIRFQLDAQWRRPQ